WESNITFAQSLTEAARAMKNVLVVAALPLSNIELGGEYGGEALTHLKNTFGRIDSPWRPASASEGFEIVRRRLFQPLESTEHHKWRDAVIRDYGDMYRAGKQDFPSDCSEGEYLRRMEGAYPVHPELFDRLNSDWASLDKFQRTRGVLRLLAKVIHKLWERQD